MFPYGWPGRGLLLLRLGIVAILTHDGIRAWMGAPQREPIALYVVAAIAGVFLLLGLWTPVAGAIIALSEIRIVLTGATHLQSTILFGDDRALCPSTLACLAESLSIPEFRVLSFTPPKSR
jgi:hypothetical protein